MSLIHDLESILDATKFREEVQYQASKVRNSHEVDRETIVRVFRDYQEIERIVLARVDDKQKERLIARWAGSLPCALLELLKDVPPTSEVMK